MSSYGRVVLRWTAAATQRSLITGRSFAALPATRLLLPVGVSGAVRHNVVHLLLARLTRTGGGNDSRRVSPSIYLYRDYRKRIFLPASPFPTVQFALPTVRVGSAFAPVAGPVANPV